jgi:hypothetical protein
MFGLFNIFFIPAVYKDPNKLGIPFLVSGIVTMVYAALFEFLVQIVPAFKAALDNTDPARAPIQLAVLAFGIVFYTLTLWATYTRSVKNFENVDL